MQRRALDSFDRKLLRLVQQDDHLTAEALAERIGLSASAIQRRLKRLEADGFIVGHMALVDPTTVGNPTFFVVALEVERERLEHLARLRQWLTSEEWVQQTYYVTGTADFVLIVTAPSVQAYDDFMTRLMTDNPNVRRFTTNVVLGINKRSLCVPIEDDGDQP
ncbi:Lrp/AsnC family transcriptional regulator [Pendulispora albinea]|uniref:Lrp/AsnC family transcriptional regulator n=1 Tax=Pendulispora albinea TaxID=2741071 RepID=A0ABZ2LXG4_9BACT